LASLFAILNSCGGADVERGEYDPRYGTFLGRMVTLDHDVTGDVYAVDNITIHIRGFSYDGEAPDAYFFAGNRTPKPTNRGFIIPNEKGKKEVLSPYRNKNLVLKFPITRLGQRGFYNIKWISVWCQQFAIDFGHVQLPKPLITPEPSMGSPMEGDNPGTWAAQVMRANNATIIIKDFSHDGSVDDAVFVMGSDDPEDVVQLPDEKGRFDPIKKYDRKTLRLTIPEEVRGLEVRTVGVVSLSSRTMLANSTLTPSLRITPSKYTLV